MSEKKSLITCLAAAFIFFSIINASAYRPLGTEDAGVGPMGEIVIEGAWNYAKEAGAATNEAGFAFVYGLGFAEIAVEGPYVWTEDENGFGDFTIFGKVSVLGSSEKEGTFTIKAEAKLKTGDEEKGLGSGFWEFAGSGVFSKGFGPMSLLGGGIIFKLPNTYLDAGLGKGLNDEADDWTVMAGITLVI